MLTLSPSLVSRYKVLKIISITSAVWVLGTAAFSAASEENVRVRLIGDLDSVIADRVLGQVHEVKFSGRNNSPILLQGETLSELRPRHMRAIEATYQAGHTIVLLDPTMAHVTALHQLIGEGMNYRSKNSGRVMAYTLRQENHIPTATILTNPQPSPLHPPAGGGDPDPTGLEDDERAFDRAADLTVTELRHIPTVSVPGPPRDPSQPNSWQDNPLQTTTFHLTGQGVYTTVFNVYSLHACLDSTDQYVVTAGADWTATDAKWQTASTSDGTMFLDGNNNLVINWKDERDTLCSSPHVISGDQHICRYINYPMSYDLKMVPSDSGAIQIMAAPAATQGQATTYTSGFSFMIGGTVNVNAMGPGAGLAAGATWNNTTATTVPPLIVEVSNTNNEGVNWAFKYCTTGLDPDPDTNCTGRVQMERNVCIAKLGEPASGTNPQQGQTPVGKFSNTVQSARWQTPSTARVGSTFDIEVDFQANLATTTAHLSGPGSLPDPDQGCNDANCACVSETTPVPVAKSFVFQVPFPSTTCK